jgi:hypothetical protein
MVQRKLKKGKKEIVDLNNIQTKFVEYSDEDQKAEENFRTNTFVQRFNHLNNLVECLIDENLNLETVKNFVSNR